MSSRRWGFVAVGVMLGCSPRGAGTPPAEVAQEKSPAPAKAPEPAPANMHGTLEGGLGVSGIDQEEHLVRLQGRELFFDGRKLTEISLEKVGITKSEAEPIRELGPGSVPYSFELQDATVRGLKNVIYAFGMVGRPEARLKTKGGEVNLSAFAPRGGVTKTVRWPEKFAAVVLRKTEAEVFAVERDLYEKQYPSTDDAVHSGAAVTSKPAATPKSAVASLSRGVYSLSTGQKTLERVFEKLCGDGTSCERIPIQVDNDLSIAELQTTLENISKAVSPAPTFELRVLEPAAKGSLLAFGALDFRVTGRLPAEEIRRVVREQFGLMRKCYEAGLGRDAELQGKVVMRFVIGRDGSVSAAAASEDQTTMPDQEVTACVVKAFSSLKFAKPEGGIVKVTYPIQFSPG